MTTIKAIQLASLVTAINVLVAGGFSIAAIISLTPFSSVIIRVASPDRKIGRHDRPPAQKEGSADSLTVYAKASPTISSLFFQRAFALSGSRAYPRTSLLMELTCESAGISLATWQSSQYLPPTSPADATTA